MSKRQNDDPQPSQEARRDAEQIERTLVWNVARGLTTMLEQGRGQLARLLDGSSRQASHLAGLLSDASEDLLSYLWPGNRLEDLYAWLGVASSGALLELDERIDEVEVKVEEVARKRAQQELLLLQQRLNELEAVLATVQRKEAGQAVGTLVSRLSELESRIDALPWPASGLGSDGQRPAS